MACYRRFVVAAAENRRALLLQPKMGIQQEPHGSSSHPPYSDIPAINSAKFCINSAGSALNNTLAVNGVAVASRVGAQSEADKQREWQCRQLWRTADAVCFDVDSTVCLNEAIDDLAAHLGVSDEVARCTRNAMSGQMSFRDALKLRLDLMMPSQRQVADFIAKHQICLTPGIDTLIEELHRRNVTVYLVSGGFRSIIQPVAERLGISVSNIFANEILFDATGNYAGFDTKELTSDSGSKNVGKAGVCALLKSTKHYKTLVMVGDGATDAEACPPADAFIGFGGNQVRESVKKLADWYVYSFGTLLDELRKDGH